jgi:signal transduction histidine kinase
MAHNDAVRTGRAGTLTERVRVAVAAFTGSPDWPFVTAGMLSLVAMVEIINRASSGTVSTVAMLLALCVTLPVALVRTQLLAAAVPITVATLLTLLSGSTPPRAGVVGLALVCYLLGRRHRRRVWMAVIAPFVVYAVTPYALPGPGGRYLGVLLAALTVGAAAIGAAGRAREEARERKESRRAIADTMLEHAARGERARIARDLHDVVAHHLSMISVQAESARLTIPGMPPEATKRLSAISATARSGLTEMRRLLGVLREDAGGGNDRKPQPGFDQLNELIDEARDLAGACTRLIVRGGVVPLDSGVELAAYRIIQEALTNARRHAPGAAVDVELGYAGETLRVTIRDNGPGLTDEAPTGHGLQGMRERAAMVGGALRIASASAGGFLVEATLPMSTVDI